MQFRLTDGTFYETYSSHCIDREKAEAVMIDFLETNGGRSTWIAWQKD